MAIFDVSKHTHVIDFDKQPEFTDPRVADGCVEVMTSDGKTGTLSHLSIHTNTRQFANDLRNVTGPGRIPVCLVGGFEPSHDSRILVNDLRVDLSDAGYEVSTEPEHSDLLGNCSRQSTLRPDEVVVKRKHSRTTSDTRRLSFPGRSKV